MAEHEPLEVSDRFSDAAWNFLISPAGSTKRPKYTKLEYLEKVFQNTPRPTDPTMYISTQALLGEKLHDGEPELVISEVEKSFPTFFENIPRRKTELTMDHKKNFLSTFVRIHYRNGRRSYGKLGLRKEKNLATAVKSDPSDINQMDLF